MTTKELNSYRLTSMEEPTDEQLSSIMKKVAKVAKAKSKKAHKELFREINDAVNAHKEEWAKKYKLASQ